MRGTASLSCKILVLLLLAPTLPGCLSAPTAQDQRAQRVAVERLNACLERQRGAARAVSTRSEAAALHRCQGYKRDVIHTYPRHYSRYIDALLDEPDRFESAP